MSAMTLFGIALVMFLSGAVAFLDGDNYPDFPSMVADLMLPLLFIALIGFFAFGLGVNVAEPVDDRFNTFYYDDCGDNNKCATWNWFYLSAAQGISITLTSAYAGWEIHRLFNTGKPISPDDR